MNNIIEIKEINKKYNTFSLKNISFTVKYGKIVGLIGQNGNGKTTIIKCLLNLISFQGEVNIFGKEINQFENDIKEDIGVVFDQFPFDECLNARKISKIMKSIYKKWSEQKYKEYLEKFQLSQVQKFKEYSKGMQTKLMLAIALSHEAKLLILDEPTSGLDPIFRKEILEELKRFVEEGDKSILFSTHITSDLEEVADNVIFVNNGEIIFCGSKKQMLEMELKNGKKVDDVMVELIKKVNYAGNN